MTVPEGAGAWRKSSYSGQGQDCVEVCVRRKTVAVRDSKDPGGGSFELPAEGWQALTVALTPQD
jgi:hypothetical protein